jgi:hypothetical protein
MGYAGQRPTPSRANIGSLASALRRQHHIYGDDTATLCGGYCGVDAPSVGELPSGGGAHPVNVGKEAKITNGIKRKHPLELSRLV